MEAAEIANRTQKEFGGIATRFGLSRKVQFCMLGPNGMVILAESSAQASPLRLWNDKAGCIGSAGQKKPFVLLIEDNAGDAFLVEEALREYQVDCDLIVLDDGEEAMLCFDTIDSDPKSPVPNLVLLDLNLPKRSGYEILNRIRRGTRCPTMPVMVVSSSQAESDLARTSELGVAGYFHKPASFDAFMELGALVRDLL